MWAQNLIRLSAAVPKLSTLDFDREYLWNGSSNRQAENGVSDYDSSYVDENNWVNFGPLTKKMTLTFDL